MSTELLQQLAFDVPFAIIVGIIFDWTGFGGMINTLGQFWPDIAEETYVGRLYPRVILTVFSLVGLAVAKNIEVYWLYWFFGGLFMVAHGFAYFLIWRDRA